MNYCTVNTYEMKREILSFSEKISEGVNKSTKKIVMDMQYGLSKSGSCLISNIARALDEKIKLSYTIERLCDNLSSLYQDEKNYLENLYVIIVIRFNPLSQKTINIKLGYRKTLIIETR